MKRFNLLSLGFLLVISLGQAQQKIEREHRIRKAQFPEKAYEFMKEELETARRLRYYMETDSARTSYELKFRQDRLQYSVEFDKEGTLEDIEVLIGRADIPEESLEQIESYLDRTFRKYRIRKMQQQYPVSPGTSARKTLRNAFQNLLIPELNYELMVGGKKKEGGYKEYEVLFDADGNFMEMKTAVSPNYDHVLY